ncbi:hypothetical protein SAMN05444173_1217 [Opitutus sp. GAS368]|jgi:hypothetical protein|nr:hypothetical protein SAMN05444173_1217 [Opitutus sp. GAS368]
MKRFKAIALFLTLMVRLAAADEFWQQLTPDERAAAGLEQLTPEQRAVLDRLAARYAKEGARRAVEVAKEKAKEEGRAEARATAQEKKKASIGLAPREDDETEVVRTHIQGDFHGWTGHTDFVLENGQRWQQVDSDQRFFPKMVDPEVEIRPSRLGGWKMTLLSEGLWIRVKRIR